LHQTKTSDGPVGH